MFENTTGFTLPSTRRHGVSLRQTNRFNVLRSVVVAVVNRYTTSADPTTNRERHLRRDYAATRATLGTWIPTVNLSEVLAVPSALVLGLQPKPTKTSVTDALGEAVVPDHAAHVQVLNADHVEAFDQIGRDLVQVVRSGISDVCVNPGNLELLSLPTSRTLRASRQNPLRFGKALLVLSRVLRVVYPFTIRERGEAVDAEVYANRQPGLRQRLNIFVQHEGDKIPSSTVLGYRDRGWIAFEASRPANVQPTQTRNLQTFRAGIRFETGACLLSGLIAVFAAELRVARSFVEEIAERGLKVTKSLLCWHARDFVHPLRLGLLLQQC